MKPTIGNGQKMNVRLENLGTVNKNKVTVAVNGGGTLRLWFSYETIVAYELMTPTEYDTMTIKNYWSRTTGKLLNELQPDHSKRVDETTFKAGLKNAFNSLFPFGGGSQ